MVKKSWIECIDKDVPNVKNLIHFVSIYLVFKVIYGFYILGGLDFYFAGKQEGRKLVDFLLLVVPCR